MNLYGSLFQEFDYEKGLMHILYYPILGLRGVIFVLNQLFFSENEILYFCLHLVGSLWMLFFLIYYRSFKSKLSFAMNLVIEISIVLIIAIMMFKTYSQLPNKDLIFDFCFIGIILSGLGLQYILTLVGLALKIKSILKKNSNNSFIKKN